MKQQVGRLLAAVTDRTIDRELAGATFLLLSLYTNHWKNVLAEGVGARFCRFSRVLRDNSVLLTQWLTDS